MDIYKVECQYGRDAATQALRECKATGNMPKIVREVRAAAADETGYGVGFLYALAREAVK